MIEAAQRYPTIDYLKAAAIVAALESAGIAFDVLIPADQRFMRPTK